ncbi:Rod shape-determining protein MreB [Caballeronia glathei]|jgi:rod shape-determining protein MreB|uniref:rod shape-determining protein n=1 Tax=Caballeronia glathei TaxID=60547 RepID=UPI0005007171|nr:MULTISPECIES: rod shape-determining protein [Burkholderiaceae]TCK38352.1 rod shape-determining protein MreB [Paraburkholderia sp. BL8N3]CDY78415.1 Rod shape-determining protein MreB [Caballeronia glathei]
MALTQRFRQFFHPDIALDVGTANTRIHVRDKGVVLNEASVICIGQPGQTQRKADAPQSVGAEAKRMLGRLPGHIEGVRPIKGGVIAHFAETQRMIRQFIGTARAARAVPSSPRVTVSVASSATQVERHAIREAVHAAGAAHVTLLEKPIAAALGAGLSTRDGLGTVVVDIGAGTTEIGVVAFGSVAHKTSARVGGDAFDNAIISYMRRTHGLLIGEHTAERLKQDIGCAVSDGREIRLDIIGRNLLEGIPRTLGISSHEIFEALKDPLNQIVSLLKGALENTPPELAADIADRGIVLTGGGALLRGIDQRLANETGLRVLVAANPMTCVVRGTGIAIDTLGPYAFE